MDAIFLKLLNMSITAIWVIIAVILLRFLLRRVPKWIICLLWGIAAIRLVLPSLPESDFSILPSGETISPSLIQSHTFSIQSGVEFIDRPINKFLSGRYYEGVTVSYGNGAQIMTILGYVWLIGVILMLTYMAVSYFRLRKEISVSIQTEEGAYISDGVNSPFICGLIKPKIYLPSNIKASEALYVLEHERAHISRRDYLMMPLGFVILSVHWFNPLVWIGYILFCRDIELACDEKAIKKLDSDEKKAYSLTLLRFGARESGIAVFPPAFSEIGIKERVNMVLSYKKTKTWIIVIAVLICIISAILLLTNPKIKALGYEEQHGYALFRGINDGKIMNLDLIEYITDNDTDRIVELCLTFNDMPNGYYVYNPDEEIKKFALTDETVFMFFDWSERFTDANDSRYTIVDGRWIKTSDVSIFEDYLTEYKTAEIKIPFKIKTNGDTLLSITEIWVP